VWARPRRVKHLPSPVLASAAARRKHHPKQDRPTRELFQIDGTANPAAARRDSFTDPYAVGYTLSPSGLPANARMAAAFDVQLPFLG